MAFSTSRICHPLRLTLALSGLWLLVACGGKDEISADSDPLPLDDLGEEFSEAICDAQFRCSPLAASILQTPEFCTQIFSEQFDAASFSTLETAVEEDRVAYDSQKARECIAGLASLECDQLDPRNVPACSEAFEGPVERGDACNLDEECAGDSQCVFDGACPGTCGDFFAAGEECTDDDQCEKGLVCSDATRRCVQPSAKGEACGGDDGPQCGLLLYCVEQGEGEAAVCQEHEELFVGAEGDSCRFTPPAISYCSEGLACVLDGVVDQAPEFVCRKTVGSGDSCGFSVPSMCPVGEFCSGLDLQAADFDGVCAPLPEEGDDCVTEDGICQLGLTCVEEKCIAKKDNGQSCDESDECKSDNCVGGGCAPESSCE